MSRAAILTHENSFYFKCCSSIKQQREHKAPLNIHVIQMFSHTRNNYGKIVLNYIRGNHVCSMCSNNTSLWNKIITTTPSFPTGGMDNEGGRERLYQFQSIDHGGNNLSMLQPQPPQCLYCIHDTTPDTSYILTVYIRHIWWNLDDKISKD